MFHRVRQICTLSVLFTYGLIAIGGDALHALYHECNGPTWSDQNGDVVVQHSCGHSHHAAHSHQEQSAPHPAGHRPAGHGHDDHQHDDRHPTDHQHDEGSCLLCQHLAQAQAVAPIAVATGVSEPVSEPLVAAPEEPALWQASVQDCRGPPRA